MFDTLELTTYAFNHSDNVAEIVPELMTNAGMQVLAIVLQAVGSSNPITFVVTEVTQIATWAVGVARARIEDELGKNITFPPLQTATDTWQVSRVFEVFRSRGSGGVVLRCRGVSKPCWQSTKTFDATRDCRQCVDAGRFWPAGHAQIRHHAPLPCPPRPRFCPSPAHGTLAPRDRAQHSPQHRSQLVR